MPFFVGDFIFSDLLMFDEIFCFSVFFVPEFCLITCMHSRLDTTSIIHFASFALELSLDAENGLN